MPSTDKTTRQDGNAWVSVMADHPYLVALALIEQQGQRALPLAGRSQSAIAPEGEEPRELGHALALELLLRVWQRSDAGALNRAAESNSLILVELPMESLPEQLPMLKANWLNSGDTDVLMKELRLISSRAWTVGVEKFKPVTLTSIW